MSKWNETIQQMATMTDPTPSVQPVRVWAVVDKDGKFSRHDLIDGPSRPEHSLRFYDKQFPVYAPHRVIRVEIREVNDE